MKEFYLIFKGIFLTVDAWKKLIESFSFVNGWIKKKIESPDK